MILITGLGNPGAKYLFTRHNIGFMALDWLAKAENLDASWTDFKKSQINKQKALMLPWSPKDLILCKPQTYMNLSGEGVQEVMSYYKIEKQNLLVIQDDVDLPFGALRLQYKRSAGGHNGIKNIHQIIGDDYHRLKVGVGAKANTVKHVLGNFSKEEQTFLPELLNDINGCIKSFINNGATDTANKYNRKTWETS